MNWLDIVILVVLVGGTIMGLRTGLIKAALSLAGVIVGVMLAGRFYIPLAERLSFILQAGVAKVVAFVLILIVVMLIASLLARLLQWVTSATMLGWIDHLGGGVLGLVLGSLLTGSLLAIWARFFDITETIRHSAIAAMLLDRFPVVLALLPDEFGALRSFFK